MMSADPKALIILVDTWRARGDKQCAKELEDLVNAEPRMGVWISGEDIDKAEDRAQLHRKQERLDHG